MAVNSFSKVFSTVFGYLVIKCFNKQFSLRKKKCLQFLESNRNFWLLHSHTQQKKLNEKHFQKSKPQNHSSQTSRIQENPQTHLEDLLLISNGFGMTFTQLYTFCPIFLQVILKNETNNNNNPTHIQSILHIRALCAVSIRNNLSKKLFVMTHVWKRLYSQVSVTDYLVSQFQRSVLHFYAGRS